MANSRDHNGAMNDPPPPAADRAVFDNPLDGLLGYQLRRASTAILADLAHSLADLRLRPTEASVVLLIAANPSITQSEIGRILGIQRANMAPIAAMLTERGVIDRSRADGRSHPLRLSEAGRALSGEIHARIATHEARFLRDLPPTERAALVATLRQVWNADGVGGRALSPR